MLPQALEGDVPLNTIFWVQLNDNLTCEATDPSTNYEEGIKAPIEYCDEEPGVPNATRISFSHPFEAGFTVTDWSAGEPTMGVGSEAIGYEICLAVRI